MALFGFRKIDKLDSDMNKEFFVLKIKIGKKKYIGYIYPTNNWVEVHCFDELNFETKEYDVDFRYVPIQTGGMEFCHKDYDRGRSRIKSKWAIFGKRLSSFIIAREEVVG